MDRERRLAETFVELADTLIDDFDVIDFLQVMAARCVELLGVGAACGCILTQTYPTTALRERVSGDGLTTTVRDVRRADRHHGRRLRRDRLPARADRPQRATAGCLRRRAAAGRHAR